MQKVAANRQRSHISLCSWSAAPWVESRWTINPRHSFPQMEAQPTNVFSSRHQRVKTKCAEASKPLGGSQKVLPFKNLQRLGCASYVTFFHQRSCVLPKQTNQRPHVRRLHQCAADLSFQTVLWPQANRINYADVPASENHRFLRHQKLTPPQ